MGVSGLLPNVLRSAVWAQTCTFLSPALTTVFFPPVLTIGFCPTADVRGERGESRERAQSTSYCTMRECRPSMILRLHTRNLTDQIICLWSRRLVPITKSRNSSRNFKAVDEYRNEASVCWNCRGWQNHRA